jgi:nucleoside-diphosphate-sugar epimerase
VYIEDIISAIISAVDNEKAENKTYTIAGPEPIALKELVNEICQMLRVRRKIIYISESCINLVRFFLRPFEKRIPAFYFLFGYGKERIYDIQSAARDLAYKPTTFQKGLSLSLENK